MSKEEKKRKFHDALMNLYLPPQPLPHQQHPVQQMLPKPSDFGCDGLYMDPISVIVHLKSSLGHRERELERRSLRKLPHSEEKSLGLCFQLLKISKMRLCNKVFKLRAYLSIVKIPVVDPMSHSMLPVNSSKNDGLVV